MTTSRSRAGFTLVETLTVFGIIVLLASLVVPVAHQMQQKAKSAGCLANLRQCGVLIHLYASDHGDEFPLATVNNQGYIAALTEYLPKKESLATKNIYISPAAVHPVGDKGGSRFTYAVHNGLFGGKDAKAVKMSAVTRPGEVIMMANGAQIKDYDYHCAYTFWEPWEMNQGQGANAAAYLDRPIPANAANNVDDYAGQGHLRYVQDRNTAVNALMVDGHAVKIKRGKVLYRNVVYDQ